MYEIGTKQVAITGNTLTVAQRLPTYLTSSGGSEPLVFGTGGDNIGAISALAVGAVPFLYSGVGYDRQRNNIEGVLLVSAARTVTQDSPIQTNYNAQGVIIFLNVTANPGGAETLGIRLRLRDPASGLLVTHPTTFVIPAAANGAYALAIYPGGGGTGSFYTGANGILSRQWTASILPSAAGSWTYSVGHSLVN